MIWIFSHVLIDGWSSELLIEDIALLAADLTYTPTRPLFKSYVSFYNDLDIADLTTFWKATLSDFVEPTLLKMVRPLSCSSVTLLGLFVRVCGCPFRAVDIATAFVVLSCPGGGGGGSLGSSA